MPSLNKVMLLGYLGDAPTFRHTNSGIKTANVSLATSRRVKSTDGQTLDYTDWHRLVFFDRMAELVRDYCRKGSCIYVEGRLQTRKLTDANGVERWSTEVIVQSMQFLDKKQDDGSGRQQPHQQSAPERRPAAGPSTDEEVPF